MTIDEAIEILKYHKCPDSNGMDCGKYSCKECHEATDMAISTLESEQSSSKNSQNQIKNDRKEI